MSVGSDAVPLVLERKAGRWYLSGDPYILHRASLAIPFSERDGDRISWPATEEVAVELLWLKQRFPYHCPHDMLLRSESAKHNQKMLQARRVMAGKFDGLTVPFRDGLTPRPYQVQGAAAWRALGHVLFADQVGVGKTVQAIAAFAEGDRLPAVVVCPSNLTLQWQSELELFTPGLTSHVIGRQRTYDPHVVAECQKCGEAATAKAAALKRCDYCSGKHFAKRLADVYLVSYNLIHYWAKELGEIVTTAVYDEVQECRLSDSKKYEACFYLSSRAKYHLGLSATPVNNYGGEMFNVLQVVCPGRLGTRSVFRNTWCDGGGGQGKEPGLKDPSAFGQYLINQGMMIRRTRSDVGRELPPEQRVIHNIDFNMDEFRRMTSGAKELAKAVLRMADKDINAAGPQVNPAGQFRSMLYHATGVAKAPYVAAFVRLLLEGGEPVMLFGWHTAVYEIWARELRQFSPLFYTGNENVNVKEHNKQKFMAGESNLLVCSLGSGAGLNGIQHRCHIGVFGELAWSPAKIIQCVGRYHRDQQQNPCMTYMPVATVGADPFMMQTLGIKRLQVDGVVLQEEEADVLDSVEAAEALRGLARKFLESA